MDHPHSAIARRLKRANGHLEAIVGMIEQGRACAAIAQQLQAVESAIENAKKALIHDHISHSLERSFKAVADMVVDQCLLGVFNGALHGLQLLGDRSTGASLLDHRDDRFEMTVGSLETPRDRAMWVVHDSDLLSSRQDSSDPPRRIAD